MNAAFDLIPLLLLAVLPMIFIVQFFSDHSRKAAWAAPARPAFTVAAATTGATVVDLDGVRAARHPHTAAAAA